MSTPVLDIIQHIRERQDQARYQNLHWEGTFQDYLDMVMDAPQIARNAFQRLYDMVVSFGTRRYTEYKKEIIHYNFFDDPIGGGKDAIFGLDLPLMKFVQVLKAASMGYGPERRVLLLHGPVGSAKSTICRLLKKGLEHYSRTPEGALYTFTWVGEGLSWLGIPPEMADAELSGEIMPCPMHEEPLHLIPQEFRGMFLEQINEKVSNNR